MTKQSNVDSPRAGSHENQAAGNARGATGPSVGAKGTSGTGVEDGPDPGLLEGSLPGPSKVNERPEGLRSPWRSGWAVRPGSAAGQGHRTELPSDVHSGRPGRPPCAGNWRGGLRRLAWTRGPEAGCASRRHPGHRRARRGHRFLPTRRPGSVPHPSVCIWFRPEELAAGKLRHAAVCHRAQRCPEGG